MSILFYCVSGSPYAWKVWLALEHKGLDYELRLLSMDAGDLRKPELMQINPRGRVPALVDDDLVLYESSAIVEYLEDAYERQPRHGAHVSAPLRGYMGAVERLPYLRRTIPPHWRNDEWRCVSDRS